MSMEEYREVIEALEAEEEAEEETEEEASIRKAFMKLQGDRRQKILLDLLRKELETKVDG